MTNPDRMIELIQGDVIPETLEECTLVEFYSEAILGHGLIECIMPRELEFEQYSNERIKMAVYGYSIGQKHYEDRIEKFKMEDLKPSDDDNLH